MDFEGMTPQQAAEHFSRESLKVAHREGYIAGLRKALAFVESSAMQPGVLIRKEIDAVKGEKK